MLTFGEAKKAFRSAVQEARIDIERLFIDANLPLPWGEFNFALRVTSDTVPVCTENGKIEKMTYFMQKNLREAVFANQCGSFVRDCK